MKTLDRSSKLPANLVEWYSHSFRDFPWRKDRDAYRIWISEIMLQQTTTKAVVPYYEKFLNRFPNLKSLATSPVEDVLRLWSGLGYYSRARNLHRTAGLLHKRDGFPKTYAELEELPGFGPYTSRAVSSLAFGERVGVVDGNVIRVVTRVMGWPMEWWKTKERNQIQEQVDIWANKVPSDELNQGLMELGATICTPKSPKCMLCPWMKNCESFNNDMTAQIPRQKPRRTIENWLWEVDFTTRNNKLALIKNDYAPFLKKQWLFPGTVKKLKVSPKKKPGTFDLTHSITHHQIFIKLGQKKSKISIKKNIQDSDTIWVKREDVVNHNPTSLVSKILEFANDAKKAVQIAKISVAVSALVFFVSCSSKGKKSGDLKAPKGYSPSAFEPVVTEGESSQARFSQNGKKLIFISSKRFKHSNTQVYEMTLDDKKVKRVTFSDGENDSPIIGPNPHLVYYSSTTDEAKEDPDLFRRSSSASEPVDPAAPPVSADAREIASQLPAFGLLDKPFEIYVSNLNGNDINRLTKNRGFDSDLEFHPKKNALLFSSLRDGQTDLISMEPGSGRTLRITNSPDFDLQARYSPDGMTLAWIQARRPFSESHLFVGNPRGSKPVAQISRHSAYHLSPTWHPEGKEIVFSSNMKSENFELYAIHPDGTCLRRLTFDSSDETEPVFSPDGSYIYFTSTKSNQKQIYRIKFTPPDACTET